MNVSEETSLTKQSDMEVKTPEKGLKLNTSTPKSSQKNKVTCSPWGHHYSKQSQDSLHNVSMKPIFDLISVLCILPSCVVLE